MIRIAVVEDDDATREQIHQYLQQYGQESNQQLQISLFSDGDQSVHRYQPVYDIILMDVEMKFLDGMSAAEEIRKLDEQVIIIFITNMAQYAIRGYEVNALDYILKPVSYFHFSQRLAKAVAKLDQKKEKTMTLNTNEGRMRIALPDIFYIESQKHLMIIHAQSGNYEVWGKMQEYEDALADEHFFRANKGYLINLRHVSTVKDGCAVVNGELLGISRGRKKDFMDALTEYWGGVL